MTSDSEKRGKQGLLDAFLNFRGRLARAVGRIVQPHDIEDIVQETFIRCYEASATTTIRHPRSFMLTTAKNLAVNHVVKAETRLTSKVASFDESAVPLYAEQVEDAIERDERFQLFCRAVRGLPVQCRRAFLLKKVYGLSRKEIATYMGITESTVQKHVAKGLALCADFLEAAESEVSAGAGDPVRRRKRGG
jgi:RNA polymerase sigma-70 factor (ECF subfamily)